MTVVNIMAIEYCFLYFSETGNPSKNSGMHVKYITEVVAPQIRNIIIKKTNRFIKILGAETHFL